MSSPTYFASRISKNQAETTHGYRICLGTPICRTGPQDYMGSELMQHSDYQESWNLDPDTSYKVYRPLSEVTSQATIASCEGNTVVDTHPTMIPGSLVTLESDRGLNCGHGQNVRVANYTIDGETVLVSDLHIKEPELLDKIDEGSARDISCGYTYRLRRQVGGKLYQADIRGNHIAVVPQGRAGGSISIQDAAFTASAIPSPLSFFAGVSYATGKAAYDAHVASTTFEPRSPLSYFAGVPYSVGKAAYEASLRRSR